jgi:tRNA (mo5U34)-methyltransferase
MAGELAPWFHNLHLPNGRQTAPDHPLGDFPAFKWRQIAHHVPADLSGKRALDIGCNAGFYSFELAGRGAQVLAIDVEMTHARSGKRSSPRSCVRARPPGSGSRRRSGSSRCG